MKENNFSFGIYPGGQLGTPAGMTTGAPDNPDKILDALDDLQGEHYTLAVRCYIIYKGSKAEPEFSPADPQRYAVNGRLLDLVLCFHSFEEEVAGWKKFIEQTIRDYHPYLGKLQITEEANVNLPVLDGHYPNSRVALVEGIVFARQILKGLGLSIPIGFNATPDFNPNKSFWKEIKSLANAGFYDALSYVGLDFFPTFSDLCRMRKMKAYWNLLSDILSVNIAGTICYRHQYLKKWPFILLKTAGLPGRKEHRHNRLTGSKKLSGSFTPFVRN